MSRYSRVGESNYRDRKQTICVCVFLMFTVSSIFIAAGGLVWLFPPAPEDPALSQLYRTYVYVETTLPPFLYQFQLDIIMFNATLIEDRFRMTGLVNDTFAKASGNKLWSLNTMDGITVELENIYPTDMTFHWYGSLYASEVSTLAPSEANMYGWTFEYKSYFIRIQLGPKLNLTGD